VQLPNSSIPLPSLHAPNLFKLPGLPGFASTHIMLVAAVSACTGPPTVQLFVCAASGEVGELLDRAVLIYRLGAVQAFKGSQYQLQGQDAALAQVCTAHCSKP
jgi:hypothetical protein